MYYGEIYVAVDNGEIKVLFLFLDAYVQLIIC